VLIGIETETVVNVVVRVTVKEIMMNAVVMVATRTEIQETEIPETVIDGARVALRLCRPIRREQKIIRLGADFRRGSL
jgi:hypothetical protein